MRARDESMHRVCPSPRAWAHAFERLKSYSQLHPCSPPSPPPALILSGWHYTNDVEKKERWEQTLAWAAANGCSTLLTGISEVDFYFVHELSSYAVGPYGGPMYLPWNNEPRSRPSVEELQQYTDSLSLFWPEIVGTELALITRPMTFTGKKARRLLVEAEATASPPWGSWSDLSHIESKRRTFTLFRTSINAAIAPHGVDHIDFAAEPRVGAIGARELL
jgi:hypothetical protein